MAKADFKQLLVEISIPLSERLDGHCTARKEKKAGFVRNAIETLLDHSEGSSSRFVIEFDDDLADDLEAFRSAHHGADPTQILKDALRKHITEDLRANPGVRQSFEEKKRELTGRRRQNVSRFRNPRQ